MTQKTIQGYKIHYELHNSIDVPGIFPEDSIESFTYQAAHNRKFLERLGREAMENKIVIKGIEPSLEDTIESIEPATSTAEEEIDESLPQFIVCWWDEDNEYYPHTECVKRYDDYEKAVADAACWHGYVMDGYETEVLADFSIDSCYSDKLTNYSILSDIDDAYGEDVAEEDYHDSYDAAVAEYTERNI